MGHLLATISRFALRLLAKDRAYALAVILTLALCLGANAAVFAVVQSVLIRPLPYPDADRIVFTYDAFQVPAWNGRAVDSEPLRSRSDEGRVRLDWPSISSMAFAWGKDPQAEGVPSMTVTPSFFRGPRATAARGRLFTEADGELGSRARGRARVRPSPRDRPAGIDHVVGTTLRLEQRGLHRRRRIMPAELQLPRARPPGLEADGLQAQRTASEDQRWSQNFDDIGRLAPAVTVAAGASRLTAYNAALVQRAGSVETGSDQRPLHRQRFGCRPMSGRDARPALRCSGAGSSFVLLIAAVNLTNLALVRSSGRAKEFATRHALGASSVRVVRQLVTETLLLTLIGGGLGILLGMWCIESLPSIDPPICRARMRFISTGPSLRSRSDLPWRSVWSSGSCPLCSSRDRD